MCMLQCPHSPGHAVPDVSVYEHRARGLGGGGGGLRGGGEDRATLGECNSISALAQCFGLAGQGTSFISSAVEPVWRGWQMGIETENRRCS